MARQAEQDRIKTIAALQNLTVHEEDVTAISKQAKDVLKQCEDAYRASTSVGLAAAFSERAADLSKSTWTWLGCLVAALSAAVGLGLFQLDRLAALIQVPHASSSIIFVNFLTSLLSVGAPIWLAWLATKQIGQRFRLSEDYAFKASISRAYEGYRKEAANIDVELQAQLLGSALSRLDELPLRLVETHSHGSPWGELLQSEAIRDAIKTVPHFVSEVSELARGKLRARPAQPGKRPQEAAQPEGPNE